MQRFYTAIIEKSSDGFGVSFPDLPGCTSFGTSVEEAAANAYVAAQAHVAISEEHGDSIPTPRPPDQIPSDPKVREKARVLIPVEIGSTPVRVNISLPSAALEALDRTAKELSLSRSGAIAHLALEHETKSMRGGQPRQKTNRRSKA